MYDDIDRKILALLQEDAERSITEIAAEVGLTQTPCWPRIKRLEEDGVILRRVYMVRLVLPDIAHYDEVYQVMTARL